jgi:hypothetical protein
MSTILETDNNEGENENEPVNDIRENDIIIDLQLGDVIQIFNPTNEKLNEQIFIIDYIDKSKTFLINTDTLERNKLNISTDGTIGDGNITGISLLSRSDSPSYAKQHNLLPNTWINIYFGGDYPIIITGEITNLEEDMIEIKTIDGDVLYINFEYKGIPEDLPVDNIEIREKPYTVDKEVIGDEVIGDEVIGNEVIEEGEEQYVEDIPEIETEHKFVDTEKIQISIPTKNVKDQLREFILKADQITFGDEELGPIVQYVDVSVKFQRYSLETQLTDLLDELLSRIPNAQRTTRVLNNIHTMVERFKQLREHFSIFDKYGNVEGSKIKAFDYKPLIKYFQEFKTNLYWLLPVVKNVKKIYNANEQDEENSDLINIELGKDLNDIVKIIGSYKSSTLPVEQNKYALLYNELTPYFTPFNLINDETVSNIVVEKEVQTDINLIIDNLEDMYSSVFTKNQINSRRFVIQKYNLGLSKLDTIESTGSRNLTTRIKMAKNDIMSIKSFMTLPEPTLRFSKINLPGTNILDKSNLNLVFLNYWELLKKKTIVNNHFIDNFENTIMFNENNFVNTIKNYVLNLNEDDIKGMSKNEIYEKFIDMIIPKTRILFELIKKYIIGKLSIVDVVSYLEPFLVYTDDLTYMQYVEIINFISQKISDFNKTYIERSRIFMSLSKVKSESIIFSNAYSIINLLRTENNIRDEVFNDGYAFDNTNNVFTNSEILRKITIKDYTKLYTSALSIQNMSLMFPSQMSDLFDEERKNIDNKLKDTEDGEKCKPIIVAKYYNSLSSLEDDNDKVIYFDKKYDKTNYTLLDNYEKEIVQLEPEDLQNFIKNDLIKKYRLSESDADYLANTLLDGHKKVLDGQYAILYKGYNQNIHEETEYYVRKTNKWEISKEIPDDINTDDPSILCNLQETCVSVTNDFNSKCENIEKEELDIQGKLLKNIVNEFDMKYQISKEQLEKEMKEKYEYLKDIILILSQIETNNLLKYNNQKYKLTANILEEIKIKPVSPNAQLLNLILSQQDFVKKQNDLIKFVNTYTRPAVADFGPLNEVESEHWLYCIKTNVPLLPIFKYELACIYTVNPNGYNEFMDTLITKIGKLSDDGDYWTDKYSGWPICKIDFDIEEGYEEGFKVSTRAVLEEDAGNKIMAPSNVALKYTTPETKTINNIVNALSISMGINIENQKEFIINCVLISLRDTLESKSEYNEKVKHMAEKGKKIMSYNDFYNTSILYYTLGMFLIAVQTAIPSVKTRKTHPGCIRSFIGYPFEGTGDYSSLNYLACVAYDIRESGEPWNVLKGKKPDIINSKIKGSIDSVLLMIPDVKRKFEEKTDYLLTNPSSEIPEEHDIVKWKQFLPPLNKFKIKSLANISEDFKRSLLNDLRSGSEKQREKILIVYTKIIQFSLSIQESIYEIVKKNNLLLHNSNNEPYLENACCDSKENENTIQYFMSRDPKIKEYNETVNKLTNLVYDIISYSKSNTLCSVINTQNKYPVITNKFDELTIYLSFIYFCKFKSLAAIPEDLIPLCTDKPDRTLINPNDTIERIIQKLKDDGRNYTNDQFLRLLQLIGRKNIIHLNIKNNDVSSITKLIGTLESIDDENDEVVEPSLRKLINNALDTFDIATKETKKEIKDLNNFLIKNIEIMKEEIIDFVDKNSGSDVTKSSIKKMSNTIKNLSNWSLDESKRNEDIKISNDNMYYVINFYKMFIDYFVNVFPNIILNKVEYNNTLIPNYYGFSTYHKNKLNKYINSYYEKLKPFYGSATVINILQTIQKSCKNLSYLSKVTPSFTSIKIGDTEIKPVFDERTSKFIYEYYLLRVLLNYIDLTDDDDMVVTEVQKEIEVTDIFSVDYIEDIETRVDLTMNSRKEMDNRLVTGNKKLLRQKTSELLIAFIDIMYNQKDTVDTSYEEIQDRVFKLKEKEKDLVTDRLKGMTDELRDADTILKINKLGLYSKSLQKGLTIYDKDFYDEERELREEMEKTEKIVRKKNKNATDDNIDLLMDDYIEQQQIDNEIDEEAYDMNYINEDFFNGNTDGVDAPEEEYEDYEDYY